MEELKKEWAKRAQSATDGSDANFWSIMASKAPLSNFQVDACRALILDNFVEAAGELVKSLEEYDIWFPPVAEAQIPKIKEAIAKCEDISDMLSYPEALKGS